MSLNVGDLVRFSRSTSPAARANIYVIETIATYESHRGTPYYRYTIKPVHSFMEGSARRVKNASAKELTPVDLIELGKEFMRFQTFIETYVKGKSSDQSG